MSFQDGDVVNVPATDYDRWWIIDTGNQVSFPDADFELVFTITFPPPDSEIIENPSSLWIQSGANENQGLWVDRYDCRSKPLGIDPTICDPLEEAEKSLAKLDNAIDLVNSYRANAGAQQNRLESTSNYLRISSENLSSAESRIRDTDIAKEMMEFTKGNILSQAGVSILAQANQSPNRVLDLLR